MTRLKLHIPAFGLLMAISAPAWGETSPRRSGENEPCAPAPLAEAGKKKKPAVKNVGNTTCPVSGHPVGSMQAGSSVTYKNYRVGLCCDSCKQRFLSDPDTYLQKALAEKKQ